MLHLVQEARRMQNEDTPGLIWEQVKSSRADAHAFALDWQVHRARVPGGWLVLVLHNTSGLTFYPDPQHQWTGDSR